MVSEPTMAGDQVEKIDSNHPFHLGPSDAPGSVLVQVKLTGSENYGLWSRAMRIALLGKKKLGFVTSMCTKESNAAALHEELETCNAIVLSWIMNIISEDLLTGIDYASNTYLIRVDLKESSDKIKRVRIWQLHKEITTLMQGTNSVSVYFSKLKELWHEYDVLVPSPNCGCEKSKDHIEHLSQQRLLHCLSGLNESYDQARRQILMKSTTPALGQAYAMIIQDETQQVVTSNLEAKTCEINLASMTAKQDEKIEPKVMQIGYGRGFKGKQCEHCGMKGHTKENCYKIVSYPLGFQSGRSQGNGNSSNSDG